jgi:hypothetical protein
MVEAIADAIRLRRLSKLSEWAVSNQLKDVEMRGESVGDDIESVDV